MDIIHLLPDSVANQIAAGEVVQRPSSVIKELMENSVDAGATSVDVFLLDAGRTSIQVIDDGKGMSDTDARMAFERHATSKIQKAEDLFTLQTMGFRGEALPSIAAVSQVRLQTRTINQELGTSLSIDGSQVISQEPCSSPVGTNIEVRNLFYNLPARRKFLKSNQTELNNLMQEYERIVLVNPMVSFSLSHNGNLLSKLPASSLKPRIVSLFGKRLDGQLLPVQVETTLVNLSGFVGKPESARKKGVHQYLFVNGRYMRHPYFHKAVMSAFEHLIPEGEQVPYFLYFQVDPSSIDVNVHPTKTEIKFENESAVWQIVMASIKETLGRFNAVPTIDFDTTERPEIPVFDAMSRNVAVPEMQYDEGYNPFRKSKPQPAASASDVRNWETLYGPVQGTQFVSPDFEDDGVDDLQLFDSPESGSIQDISSEHFQFRGRYILTAVQSGLMLVEQHRAHERVLYDRYMRQMEQQTFTTQGLLFPEIVQFSPSDAQALDGVMDDFASLGFELSSLGGGSFSISGVPSGLDGMNPSELLTQMVEGLREDHAIPCQEIRHRLALAMARNTSIVVGQVLSIPEMDSLLNELFRCQNPNLTPSGKVIVSILPQERIDELF